MKWAIVGFVGVVLVIGATQRAQSSSALEIRFEILRAEQSLKRDCDNIDAFFDRHGRNVTSYQTAKVKWERASLVVAELGLRSLSQTLHPNDQARLEAAKKIATPLNWVALKEYEQNVIAPLRLSLRDLKLVKTYSQERLEELIEKARNPTFGSGIAGRKEVSDAEIDLAEIQRALDELDRMIPKVAELMEVADETPLPEAGLSENGNGSSDGRSSSSTAEPVRAPEIGPTD